MMMLAEADMAAVFVDISGRGAEPLHGPLIRQLARVSRLPQAKGRRGLTRLLSLSGPAR